jgi:hypothetical protein
MFGRLSRLLGVARFGTWHMVFERQFEVKEFQKTNQWSEGRIFQPKLANIVGNTACHNCVPKKGRRDKRL